jgi:hypothetical protein
MQNAEVTKPSTSKGMRWTGITITGLVVLFLLVDAIMKIAKSTPAMEGSVQLGWPADDVQAIGFVLLVSTVLYAVPRTNILGAILLTGYLGGATSIMVRADMPGHPYLFPIVFGILVWGGLFLRDEKTRRLLPLRKD